MSKKWHIKYDATVKTEQRRGVEVRKGVIKEEGLLDCPAVVTGAAKRAAVVTFPAAASAPAGREHLWMDEALIWAVVRRALSQHAPLHPPMWGIVRAVEEPDLYTTINTTGSGFHVLLLYLWMLRGALTAATCSANAMEPSAWENMKKKTGSTHTQSVDSKWFF